MGKFGLTHIFILISLLFVSCGKKEKESTINGQNPNGFYGQFLSNDQDEKTLQNISNPRDVLYLYNDGFYLHMTDRRGTFRGNWKLEANQIILANYGVASGVNFNGSNCLNVSTSFENAIFCPRTTL